MNTIFKKFIISNFLYKVIAVFMAVTTWVYIINIENPQIERTIKDVPITLINNTYINSSELCIRSEPESGKTDIKVLGAIKDLWNFDKDRLELTANIGGFDFPGSYTIPVESRVYYDNIKILNQNTLSTKIVLEKREETKLNVSINYKGNTPEGYYSKMNIMSPSYVRVSGPASIISNIRFARIEVDLSNRMQDFKEYKTIQLIDKQNGIVKSPDLVIDNNQAEIFFNVFLKKTVKIEPNFIDTPNIEVKSYTLNPEYAEIAGYEKDIEKIEYISTMPMSPENKNGLIKLVPPVEIELLTDSVSYSLDTEVIGQNP